MGERTDSTAREGGGGGRLHAVAWVKVDKVRVAFKGFF